MSIANFRRRLALVNTRLSETGWTWSPRSSDENVDPPTFGTAVNVTVLPTNHRTEREERAKGMFLVSRMNVRISNYGVVTMPTVGDKITDPDSAAWSVEDIESQEWGSTVCVISREVRKIMGSSRGRWS